MKPDWLDRALFVSPNHYCLCTTDKMFQKALDHLNVQPNERPEFILNAHASATTHFLENTAAGKKSAVVCIREPREGVVYSQIVALLVHEAVHLWQDARESYGEKEPSAELEAYAIQSFSQRLIESYDRQMAKAKKRGRKK